MTTLALNTQVQSTLASEFGGISDSDHHQGSNSLLPLLAHQIGSVLPAGPQASPHIRLRSCLAQWAPE